ncbi:hypothetical protein MOV08_05185 [Streptomyces yunnanensis]|uniref:Scaffolding protein n=1 Tax=Streptomyces yunnanensis TaxID=156453 RepID=A0ABY8A4N9_9ACTN|nr:hypothetical protein [Streptomyces yunnanensis]WEB38756.1 hypothetical protein MOV08_05185 [Streptomyces yunnanensis]
MSEHETHEETAKVDEVPEESTSPDWQAEAEKWKALARKNEARAKSNFEELEELRKAQMSDQEKALEAARQEGRNAAAGEFGTRLVGAELKAAASKAGTELPSSDFLDLNKFLGEDGSPNSEAIDSFISSLPAKPKKTPPPLRDTGPRGGPTKVRQLTADDLKHMSPREINEARDAGKLDALMRGQI